MFLYSLTAISIDLTILSVFHFKNRTFTTIFFYVYVTHFSIPLSPLTNRVWRELQHKWVTTLIKRWIGLSRSESFTSISTQWKQKDVAPFAFGRTGEAKVRLFCSCYTAIKFFFNGWMRFHVDQYGDSLRCKVKQVVLNMAYIPSLFLSRCENWRRRFFSCSRT